MSSAAGASSSHQRRNQRRKQQKQRQHAAADSVYDSASTNMEMARSLPGLGLRADQDVDGALLLTPDLNYYERVGGWEGTWEGAWEGTW